jgi:alpha-glucosidase (family GH31 glycosyl hydrolase)
VFLDGTSGVESNNRFPTGYARAYGDLLQSAGKPPVTFSRAGYVGSQAHGVFWAGDEQSTWEAFRASMIAGLNATASGVLYWGWDIAGFSGEIPEVELYLRAFAASAFVPIMQYHSEFSFHRVPSRDRTPWNIAQRRNDPTVIDAIRHIVALRDRLVPYLAEQARIAIATGTSLMRPVWFDAPRELGVWSTPLQWMLGDEILAAPVVEPGATTWPVYLPEGDWVVAWTGERVAGQREHIADVTNLSCAPAFVRERSWADLKRVFFP